MFVRPILDFLFPNAPEEMLQLYHAYVRKAAHFTEYAILAFLAVWALGRSASGIMRTLAVGLLIVVLVAALDEYNQSFSLSRTGSYVDVLLDISGGFTMLAILWMWNLLRSTTATGRTAN